MVAPALEIIAAEFKITDFVLLELTLSTFVLAYAVGPLFLGPLSEIYGRKIVLQLTNLFYIAFNITCAVSTSTGQMIAFRFLAGLGGSAPLAVCKNPFAVSGSRQQDYLDWRWSSRRLFSPGGAWKGPRHLWPCTRAGPCDRPHSRRVHCGEYHMAVGLLRNVHHGRIHSDRGFLLFARDIRPGHLGLESQKASQRDRKSRLPD